jgi:hypothetical protein
LFRISILGDLVTSLGIVILTALIYIVLNKQSKVVALVALGWWLAEAISLALSKTGAFALIPLSQDFVKVGTPEPSYYQTLGEFLYDGVVGLQGQTMHMFFYCLGGILWYSLFYQSKYIPRVISLFGSSLHLWHSLGSCLNFWGMRFRSSSTFPSYPLN